MKRITVFGSTGSIGHSTLDIIRRNPREFSVCGLAAHSDVETLARQVEEFKPAAVATGDERTAVLLKKRFGKRVTVLIGESGLVTLAQKREADVIMLAISGSAALVPLLAAIEAGKNIALANKESLVMAGDIVMRKAKQHRARLLPVDSEQSAIWQCLEGHADTQLKKIYLTASGGPLKDVSFAGLKQVTVPRVLKHPRWKMGKKITVDSATLMNKGLEVIEAMHLFSCAADTIEVLIHPQVIIHSMVEFIDGVVLAQLSSADMRLPIQYALAYPRRMQSAVAAVDFLKNKSLTFEKPDLKKFPCLRLAYEAAQAGGTAPCVMNAADEVAVEAFLQGNIDFCAIVRVIEKVLSRAVHVSRPGLDDIFAADRWAKEEAKKLIQN